MAETFFLFVEMDDEQRERGNKSGGGRNREAEKIFTGAAARHRGEAVEPREPERATQQVNRGDEPADAAVFLWKNVGKHDALDEKRGRDAERNQIGKRIEFASKRTFHAAHARDAAVEQVENARKQNKRERELDLREIIVRPGNRIHDFCQCDKAAEQVSSRQQIRQKINLQL